MTIFKRMPPSCTEPAWRQGRRDHGFTLVELSVYMFLVGTVASTGWVIGGRWIAHYSLQATGVRLVEDLRYVQAASESESASSHVQLSMYTPEYFVYEGTKQIEHAGFSYGVTYTDGYLQMTTGRVSYDVSGNSEVSGVIRLTDAGEVATVTLFMGSGLQALKVH